MFTGLVEEIGVVSRKESFGTGVKLTVSGNVIMDDLKIDDSVAINGVCQTVIAFNKNSFEVVAIEETLRKTTFGELKIGSKVNLERAAKVGDRLGGHIVQGHVDCTGNLIEIKNEGAGTLLKFAFPEEFKKYIVPVGSITINGISLTVARVDEKSFSVGIIPHTWDKTIIGNLKVGDKVNLEFDVLGKYLENMVKAYLRPQEASNDIWNQFINQPKM